MHDWLQRGIRRFIVGSLGTQKHATSNGKAQPRKRCAGEGASEREREREH